MQTQGSADSECYAAGETGPARICAGVRPASGGSAARQSSPSRRPPLRAGEAEDPAKARPATAAVCATDADAGADVGEQLATAMMP